MRQLIKTRSRITSREVTPVRLSMYSSVCDSSGDSFLPLRLSHTSFRMSYALSVKSGGDKHIVASVGILRFYDPASRLNQRLKIFFMLFFGIANKTCTIQVAFSLVDILI